MKREEPPIDTIAWYAKHAKYKGPRYAKREAKYWSKILHDTYNQLIIGRYS